MVTDHSALDELTYLGGPSYLKEFNIRGSDKEFQPIMATVKDVKDKTIVILGSNRPVDCKNTAARFETYDCEGNFQLVQL